MPSRNTGPEQARISEMRKLYLQVEHLTQIGISLTAERDLDKLLDKIVTEARNFAHADGGSLYIKDNDHLHFKISQNETLRRRLGLKKAQSLFRPFEVPLTKKSISGYVAITGEILNIEDVYHLDPSVPYEINKSFDEKNNYRTKSILSIPMKDNEGNVIGVLQLINALDESENVIAFSKEIENLTHCLASQAAIAIKNAQLTASLKKAYLDTIYHLAIAAEYRDEDTGTHIRRMSNYSRIIAKHLGWPEDKQELLLYASPMHDVGKIGIPDAILQKEGPLTSEERSTMQNHPHIGAGILEDPNSEVLTLSREIAISHHEKFDGTGYPAKIKGKEIPMSGRIVAVADVFDALTSERCYKKALSVEKALSIIKKNAGSQFDPDVVNALLEGLDEILEIKEKYKDEPRRPETTAEESEAEGQ